MSIVSCNYCFLSSSNHKKFSILDSFLREGCQIKTWPQKMTQNILKVGHIKKSDQKKSHIGYNGK